MVWRFTGLTRDIKSDTSQRSPISRFLDAVRSLRPSQRLALARELANARYDFGFAMASPDRMQRADLFDKLLSEAAGAKVTMPRRKLLEARLQKHLQDPNCPAKRERLLAKVFTSLFPMESRPADIREALDNPTDVNLPDGMTQYDIWEACQHQWCYIKPMDSYATWLRPTSDQTTHERCSARHHCLGKNHPLTILLQWTLALHSHSAKLQDPDILKQWHERATSLPDDHSVWRFAQPQKENDIPDVIHGYVTMLPDDHPIGSNPLYIRWQIGHETARISISRLHSFSKGLWHPSADSRQPRPTDGECSDAAEAWPDTDGQRNADVAGRYEAAGPDLLLVQPAQYVKQLLLQCELRDGKAIVQPSTHEQAAWPEAQKPDDCQVQSSRERLADAVAKDLLLEEEAAKAKAQAQEDAKQQRRRKRIHKASSKPELLQEPASPGEALAARSLGQAGNKSLNAEPMMQSSDHQRAQTVSSHLLQTMSSASGSTQQILPQGSSSASPDNPQGISSPQRPAVNHPVAAPPAASQQQAAPKLQPSPSQPGSVETGAPGELDQHIQSAQQQHGNQHGFSSGGACLVSVLVAAAAKQHLEARHPPADDAPAPLAETFSSAEPRQQQASVSDEPAESGSVAEPPQQQAPFSNEPADTPSSPPWETRRGRSRLKHTGRLGEADATSPSGQHCGSGEGPHPAQRQPGPGRPVDARPASSSGRCQPKAKSKSHEGSAQVRTGLHSHATLHVALIIA